MNGTMMNYTLTLTSLLERAGKLFPSVEIVSRLPNKGAHRYTYKDFHHRARALCAGLQCAGIRRSDRVATLMWNHAVHLECYFGIPAAGGVLHTLNLRLHPDELSYIANHAEDRFLIVDDVLLHLFEQIRHKVRFERVFVVQHMDEVLPEGCESYESLLQPPARAVEFADVDENEAAAMCYTSGTTGKPKGVVYSHRALALHSFSCCSVDSMAVSQADTVMPGAPLFHANGWGVPFTTAMAGSKVVLIGPYADPESL